MGDNLLPVDVGTGRTVKQVAAGGSHTCAVLDNGAVKCWGDNSQGQLGLNCSVISIGGQPNQMGDNLPAVDLGPSRTAILVAAGAYAHTCVTLDDSSIKCWGYNNYGALGFSTSGSNTCVPLAALDLGSNCTSAAVVVANGTDTVNSTPGSNTSSPGVSPAPLTSLPSPLPVQTPLPLPVSTSSPLPAPASSAASQATLPSTPALSSSSSHSTPVGAIVGPVVAMVALALIAAGAWWWRSRKGSPSCFAWAKAAASAGDVQRQSAHVVVVASDGALLDEHSLILSKGGGKQNSGAYTPPESSTTSTKPGAKGTLEDMRIPWSHITVGRVLGEGGFGTVYKAKWQSETIAVKLLNMRQASPTAVNNLYHEALNMSRLRHPCIARVYGVVDEADHHALVMQYYPKGSLAKYMTTAGYAGLELPTKLHIARQIASGMRFMHERLVPILHGDLKAANILLACPGRQVAIADFGLSQAMLAGQEAAVASGAMTYSISPPEVLDDPLAPRTRAADVYAFAIVLLEIYTSRRAFGNLWPQDIRLMVMAGDRPTLPADMPPRIEAIIKACWAQDPASRPSFAAVVQQLTAAYEDSQLTHVTDSTKTVDGTHTMTDW